MRNIKLFHQFEAVIMPQKIEDESPIKSFEDLMEFGKKHDFDVVEYQEFFDSLGEKDKKFAPPRHGVPFFALFHPIRKKPMFVVCDKNVVKRQPNFKEIMLDIIGHERVHQTQASRMKIDYTLPKPLDRKSYFSDPQEKGAFPYTIALELSKRYNDVKSAMSGLKNFRHPLWMDIKAHSDPKLIQRYQKLIYQYLEEMFKKSA